MTGRASAELICKARVTRVNPNSPKNKWDTKDQPTYEGYCGNVVRPDLQSSDELIGFNTPAGWHVEIGELPEKTIVRCPEHCRYWSASQAVDHTPHWEDAP